MHTNAVICITFIYDIDSLEVRKSGRKTVQKQRTACSHFTKTLKCVGLTPETHIPSLI